MERNAALTEWLCDSPRLVYGGMICRAEEQILSEREIKNGRL